MQATHGDRLQLERHAIIVLTSRLRFAVGLRLQLGNAPPEFVEVFIDLLLEEIEVLFEHSYPTIGRGIGRHPMSHTCFASR
jgi:hypothetical protein